MAAIYRPLFLRAEVVGDLLIMTINKRVEKNHKDWLASDQASGDWNFAVSQTVYRGAHGISTEVVSTIWFTDLKTAIAFKLTFG